ncbi:hypothetical protein BDP55DRAFT_627853 [Colletotrichum godetiae]|uniref:Uncharacterized protein n=1 Tax=Colletotrichum godetiae TaxID=1209918 RepID=A0AAJ0AWJ9_9PEZI|nr:uncharacterized protein BDP55DRAFT_627853 [Colletotrichum godetiae]KAK1690155.1 hypothetical protein BDP55DRAFT_627853 [Colletotrichum godetiae]
MSSRHQADDEWNLFQSSASAANKKEYRRAANPAYLLKCILEPAPKNGEAPNLSSNAFMKKVGFGVIGVYHPMLTPRERTPSNEHCWGRPPFLAALRKWPAEVMLRKDVESQLFSVQESMVLAEHEDVVMLRRLHIGQMMTRLEADMHGTTSLIGPRRKVGLRHHNEQSCQQILGCRLGLSREGKCEKLRFIPPSQQ